jgi:hypothetical protein
VADGAAWFFCISEFLDMTESQAASSAAPPRQVSLLAGVLSYLVPGLGQIYQGRIGKGLLFMVCLLGMFFVGQTLGDWKNVYLPQVSRGPNDPNNPWNLPQPLNPIANLYHRWHYAGQFWIGVAAWPALWQYFELPVPSADTSPFLHDFQKAPDEAEVNRIVLRKGKIPDLAWVYTVVAGVLNILVIYDAYAGPAFALQTRPRETHTPQQEVALP